jgi:cytochrome c6
VKLKSTQILLLCLTAGISLSAAAQQDATGADTFKNRCELCHGADGLGQTPAGKAFNAASLKDPKVTGMSDAELHAVVKNGKDKMPAFKTQLTDAQIDAVIAYVRKLPSAAPATPAQ